MMISILISVKILSFEHIFDTSMYIIIDNVNLIYLLLVVDIFFSLLFVIIPLTFLVSEFSFLWL